MDRVSPDKSRLRAAFYWAGILIAALEALRDPKTKADSSPRAARNDTLLGFG